MNEKQKVYDMILRAHEGRDWEDVEWQEYLESLGVTVVSCGNLRPVRPFYKMTADWGEGIPELDIPELDIPELERRVSEIMDSLLGFHGNDCAPPEQYMVRGLRVPNPLNPDTSGHLSYLLVPDDVAMKILTIGVPLS